METAKNEPVVARRRRKKKSDSPPPPVLAIYRQQSAWSDDIPTLRGIDERREALKCKKRWPGKPPMPPHFYDLT